MNRFHLLEHTADIGIVAIAGSREHLAEQAGLGLKFLLFGDTEAGSRQAKLITADGNSAAETLVIWLNELLFVCTERPLVPARIEVTCFSETRIVATIFGESFDPSRHRMLREVKAVTHHQTRVGHESNHWRATVYLDL